jgi:hypothetical protein
VVKRPSSRPAVKKRSSRREVPVVTGSVPNFPEKSVTAVFIVLMEAAALVTREDAIVENTFGSMMTARIAIMASTPIISTRLNPERVGLWDIFIFSETVYVVLSALLDERFR